MERDNETLDWKKNEKERDKRMSTARANTFYNHCTYSNSVTNCVHFRIRNHPA